MTAWLYLFVVILATRLPLLFHDRAIPRRGALLASLMQLAAAMLLAPAPSAGLLGILLVCVNLLWAGLETKFERQIYWVRLGTLLLCLALTSIFCSRKIGLQFHPEISSIARTVSNYCLFFDGMVRFEWRTIYC